MHSKTAIFLFHAASLLLPIEAVPRPQPTEPSFDLLGKRTGPEDIEIEEPNIIKQHIPHQQEQPGVADQGNGQSTATRRSQVPPKFFIQLMPLEEPVDPMVIEGADETQISNAHALAQEVKKLYLTNRMYFHHLAHALDPRDITEDDIFNYDFLGPYTSQKGNDKNHHYIPAGAKLPRVRDLQWTTSQIHPNFKTRAGESLYTVHHDPEAGMMDVPGEDNRFLGFFVSAPPEDRFAIRNFRNEVVATRVKVASKGIDMDNLEKEWFCPLLPLGIGHNGRGEAVKPAACSFRPETLGIRMIPHFVDKDSDDGPLEFQPVEHAWACQMNGDRTFNGYFFTNTNTRWALFARYDKILAEWERRYGQRWNENAENSLREQLFKRCVRVKFMVRESLPQEIGRQLKENEADPDVRSNRAFEQIVSTNQRPLPNINDVNKWLEPFRAYSSGLSLEGEKEIIERLWQNHGDLTNPDTQRDVNNFWLSNERNMVREKIKQRARDDAREAREQREYEEMLGIATTNDQDFRTKKSSAHQMWWDDPPLPPSSYGDEWRGSYPQIDNLDDYKSLDWKDKSTKEWDRSLDFSTELGRDFVLDDENTYEEPSARPVFNVQRRPSSPLVRVQPPVQEYRNIPALPTQAQQNIDQQRVPSPRNQHEQPSSPRQQAASPQLQHSQPSSPQQISIEVPSQARGVQVWQLKFPHVSGMQLNIAQPTNQERQQQQMQSINPQPKQDEAQNRITIPPLWLDQSQHGRPVVGAYSPRGAYQPQLWPQQQLQQHWQGRQQQQGGGISIQPAYPNSQQGQSLFPGRSGHNQAQSMFTGLEQFQAPAPRHPPPRAEVAPLSPSAEVPLLPQRNDDNDGPARTDTTKKTQ